MKLGSLFAGIGGFDLAARWMGWDTAWFSEVDPYASAVLAKHWPGVPNHGDITTIDFTTVEPVDMLVGGFPCQDISTAGKGVGIDGARSGLWREYARAVREMRPQWVVIENVGALTSRGWNRIHRDLHAVGYDARPGSITACSVGAPHPRSRVFIVAYPEGARLNSRGVRRRPAPPAPQPDNRGAITRRPWTDEPRPHGVAYGIPHRMDRARALGNAIVPQCALVIFQAIQAQEDAMRTAA